MLPAGKLSLLCMVALLACGSGETSTEVSPVREPVFAAPPPGILTTDFVGYVAKPVWQYAPGVKIYEFRIVTTYTNPTRDTLYLGTCAPGWPPGSWFMFAGTKSGVSIAYNQASACGYNERQILVPPGGKRIDTIKVRGPNAFDGVTKQPLDNVLTGKFQLGFSPMRCQKPGTECVIKSDSLSTSNEFTVQLAP